MIKKILILTFLLSLNGIVFSQTTSQLSVGLERADSLEINQDLLYIPLLGIELTDYTFFNGNFGVFVHTEILFPVLRDFQIYDRSIVIGTLFGPSFRIPLNSVFEAIFGIGFGVSGTFIRYNQNAGSSGQINYERNELNLGLGGDVQIKWFISNTFYMNAGNILSCYFCNHSFITSKYGGYAGFTQNYCMFSLNPYIGIGLQFPFRKRGEE